MKNHVLIITLLLLSVSLQAQKAEPNVEDTIVVKQRLKSFFEQQFASKQKSEIQLSNLVSVSDSVFTNKLFDPKIREIDSSFTTYTFKNNDRYYKLVLQGPAFKLLESEEESADGLGTLYIAGYSLHNYIFVYDLEGKLLNTYDAKNDW
jgi:hypothetical protein